MWRRERGAIEVLRIGRLAVERWKGVDGMLSLQSAVALPQDAALRAQHVAEAIRSLYPNAIGSPITLVIESAWLPVVLVDTGPALLRAAQIEALVRHRLGLHYSDSLEPVASWELRIEHRAGSRYALAYGMPPRLKQALIETARAAGLHWAAMTPALAWGLDRLRPAKAWPRATGWWAWPEQDRTMVGRIALNDWTSLNAGAERVTDDVGLSALIETEGCRLGFESDSTPIAMAVWGPAPRVARAGERISWLDLRGQGAATARSPLATLRARTPA